MLKHLNSGGLISSMQQRGDTDAMVEPTRSTLEGDEDTLEGGTPGTLPIDALPAAATFDALHRGNRSS